MDFLLILPVLLFSVVVHEVAHAWQAQREGDATARDLGRITLNPIPHLDPVGSIVVPLLLHFFGGGIIFGWAKPVPVNPRNYRDYRAGDIRVSLAGIVANLGLVVLCTAGLLLLRFAGAVTGGGVLASAPAQMLTYGIFINLILAWFNLIPLPPLDGSHVLKHLLPLRLANRYHNFGRYGITVLFLCMVFFPAALATMLAPVQIVFQWILGLVAG